MGYSYYAGFFERISLPPPCRRHFRSSALPTTSCTPFPVNRDCSRPHWPAIPYRSVVPTTIWQAFWVNAPFLVVPLVLGQNARSNGFLDQDLALLLGAVAMVAVIASLLKLSALRALTKRWGSRARFLMRLGFSCSSVSISAWKAPRTLRNLSKDGCSRARLSSSRPEIPNRRSTELLSWWRLREVAFTSCNKHLPHLLRLSSTSCRRAKCSRPPCNVLVRPRQRRRLRATPLPIAALTVACVLASASVPG